MDEFVVVSYRSERNVLIDGQLAGKTNDTLTVERGHHIFSLEGPQDYQPLSVERTVRRTTALNPMIIEFRPCEVSK